MWVWGTGRYTARVGSATAGYTAHMGTGADSYTARVGAMTGRYTAHMFAGTSRFTSRVGEWGTGTPPVGAGTGRG